jgi:hypothetical protein
MWWRRGEDGVMSDRDKKAVETGSKWAIECVMLELDVCKAKAVAKTIMFAFDLEGGEDGRG